MSVRKHDYNAIDWHSLVYYDETSPSGLRWKYKPNRNNKINSGGIAGTISNGYWFVRRYRKAYATHNIIYIMYYGKLADDKIVDHIDGNSVNNKPENLRAILPLYNKHNYKMSNKNTSGFPGVSYSTASNCWEAYVTCNGVRSKKKFACKKYGYENAKQMATDFVIAKRLELNASGEAAFTDRHIGIDTSINSSSKQENTLDACFQQD